MDMVESIQSGFCEQNTILTVFNFLKGENYDPPKR
jgi:hypothetical protein